MDILTKIIDTRRERLNNAKRAISLQEIKHRLQDVSKPLNFAEAINRGASGIRLIAEIKKASPSKGVIRSDFNPVKIAAVYEKKAVNAISVLTEEDFFQGNLSYINEVRKVTTVPLLRKDFIFDEYQVFESRANNADAILLIAAVLDNNQAAEYLHICRELGLYVLFEVHDEYELEKAFLVNADIIGINNRNLKTMSIDLSTTLRLKKMVPQGKIVVSESGIGDRNDVQKLSDAGIDAMLIGTSFMKSEDIGSKIDELMPPR